MQKIRTMIVDDEARIRRSIERMVLLSGEQFEIVAICSDGLEALETMRLINGAVDLVITDVKMPEMDGMLFVREAKKSYHFFPLFISGYDDFEYLQTALREGAVDYILKPIDREQFRERLQEISNHIFREKNQLLKQLETEKKAELLRRTKQTKVLMEVTSSTIDLSQLGYWVEDFPVGVYSLLYISLDMLPVKARSYSKTDWKAYTYAMENIINEISQQSALTNWLWRENLGFWLLLYSRDISHLELVREQAALLAKEICTQIRRFTPFTVSIALPEPIEELYLLRNIMKKAISLMTYRLVYGGNRMFSANSIECALTNADDVERMEPAFLQAVQRLKSSLARAEMDETLEHLQLCFQFLEKSNYPYQIQRMAEYVCLNIYAVWMEINESSFSSIEVALQELKRAANISELKSEMKTWIEKIINSIEQERARHNNEPVEQAKLWILAHLDSDLTVKSIADRIYMNPTYFCKYFKNQTGETVLDYITRMRIEKAKELLDNPNHKLQVICEKVGYKDVKYFSKLFKQIVGLTPSQYRDALIKQY